MSAWASPTGCKIRWADEGHHAHEGRLAAQYLPMRRSWRGSGVSPRLMLAGVSSPNRGDEETSGEPSNSDLRTLAASLA